MSFMVIATSVGYAQFRTSLASSCTLPKPRRRDKLSPAANFSRSGENDDVSAIAHAYQYLYPSALTADSGSPKLRLATSDAGGQSHPHFFDGRVREPRLVAELLTAVHLVVG